MAICRDDSKLTCCHCPVLNCESIQSMTGLEIVLSCEGRQCSHVTHDAFLADAPSQTFFLSGSATGHSHGGKI